MTVTTRKRAADVASTPRSSKRLKAASAKPSLVASSSSAQAKTKRSVRTSQRASTSSRKPTKARPAKLTPEEREKAALVAALSVARARYADEQKQLAEGGPERDSEFYLQDACDFRKRKERSVKTKKADMFVFLAENTLFRLPRSVLVKHSTLFADMFEVPPPNNDKAEGRSDDHPIILYNMKADSLRWFVRYIQGTCAENPERPMEQLHILSFTHRAAAPLAYEEACRSLYHMEAIRRPPWSNKSHAYDKYLETHDWQDLMTREYAIELLDAALGLGIDVAFFPGALASLVCDEIPLTTKEKAAFMRRDPPSLDDNALVSILGDGYEEDTLNGDSDMDSLDSYDEPYVKKVGKGAHLVRNVERARTMWAYCTRIAGEGVHERGRLGVVIRTVWIPPSESSRGWELLCVRP